MPSLKSVIDIAFVLKNIYGPHIFNMAPIFCFQWALGSLLFKSWEKTLNTLQFNATADAHTVHNNDQSFEWYYALVTTINNKTKHKYFLET